MSDYYSQTLDHLPLFRRQDPPTSKAAGRNARQFIGDHERQILDALAEGPGTKDELAARCGLSEQMVIRRIARLRRIGEVVGTGETRRTPSGGKAEVWRLNTAASR